MITYTYTKALHNIIKSSCEIKAMPSYLELIYNPDKFFREAKEEKIGFLSPLTIVLIAAILSSLSAALFADIYAKATVQMLISKGIQPDQARAFYTITYYSTMISPFVVVLISWIIFSAILHGISALFGGEGDFSTTMKFVGFCFIPAIILFPLTLKIAMDNAAIVSTQGFEGLMSSTMKLAGASSGTLSTLWQMVLWTFGIKNARGLDLRKAVIVAAIPAAGYLILTWYSLLIM